MTKRSPCRSAEKLPPWSFAMRRRISRPQPCESTERPLRGDPDRPSCPARAAPPDVPLPALGAQGFSARTTRLPAITRALSSTQCSPSGSSAQACAALLSMFEKTAHSSRSEKTPSSGMETAQSNLTPSRLNSASLPTSRASTTRWLQ